MKPELRKIVMPINNEKLTPDMKRVRSGTTMLFRKDYGDRNLINKKNADIVIEAPASELVATLIDNKWYWCNDCPECNGQEPKFPYVKCDKHNVCVSCGKNRKDIIDKIVWGHKHGFQCNKCHDKMMNEKKIAALEKVAEKEYDEWDYYNTKVLTCPHCGSTYDDIYQDYDSEMKCDLCGGNFSVEIEQRIEFTTRVIGKRIIL